jgi:hypothetical protein
MIPAVSDPGTCRHDRHPIRRRNPGRHLRPPERERSLIVRVALLENYILELDAASETLQQQNLELIDRIKTLQGML